MRRKSVILALGIAVVVVGVIVGTLVLLMRHEPEFYRERAVAPGNTRKQQSDKFVTSFVSVLNAAHEGYDFNATFTEEQINSYFEETFITSGFARKFLPDNISAPRVAIEPRAHPPGISLRLDAVVFDHLH